MSADCLSEVFEPTGHQTCQIMSGYHLSTYMNKQASNMAAYLLKKSQKYRANVAHIKHASVLSHLSPDHMKPASAMKTKRKTTNSAAACRSTQKSHSQTATPTMPPCVLEQLYFTIHKTHKQCVMYCIF